MCRAVPSGLVRIMSPRLWLARDFCAADPDAM
jgi:hypothetical protein